MPATAACPNRCSGTYRRPSARRCAEFNATHGLIEESNRIGLDEQLAGKRRHQRLLAIARDAGDADDLPASHVERHVGEKIALIQPRDAEMSNFEGDLSGRRSVRRNGWRFDAQHQLR